MNRLALLALFVPSAAIAERPILAGEATHGTTNILVHYATTGADVPPPADANTDGVPDFVAEVAAEAQAGYAKFTQLGFLPPVADALGGDARIDIYLRDLMSADGNAGTDACDATSCIGYAIAENDYKNYNYPSISEGIRSVVPHELFHLVQYAYSMEQPSTWTEGTAVWAVETLYGDRNSDFERFLPGFLSKTFRPYERGGGGFGDTYPYGAALWPYYLSERFGPDVVVAAWEVCKTASAIDAMNTALLARGSSFEAAWVDFTRANATRTPLPPREPMNAPRVFIEGYSARYIPLELATPTHLTFTTTSKIAASANDIVLDADTVLAPGTYMLTLTGLSKGTIATAVDITSGPPPEDDDGGGCSASQRPSLVVAFVLLALLAIMTKQGASSAGTPRSRRVPRRSER